MCCLINCSVSLHKTLNICINFCGILFRVVITFLDLCFFGKVEHIELKSTEKHIACKWIAWDFAEIDVCLSQSGSSLDSWQKPAGRKSICVCDLIPLTLSSHEGKGPE